MESEAVGFGKGRVVVGELFDPAGALGRAKPDDEAFTAFFAAEFGQLAAYCRRLVGAGVAEDTAQDALVRVWTHWRTVRDPHGYTFLVATNLARRQWKSDANQRVLHERLDTVARMPRGNSEAHADLRDLVDRLPSRLRTSTLLHYYADLPTEQVAHLLHRPPGTIRRQLAEARQVLGDALKETP